MEHAARNTPAVPREWWWVFDPRLSLRAAAALIAGGGALLLVLLITWASATMLRRSIETQLGSTFETLASQVADKIDRTIYERYRTLQLAANLAPLRSAETSPADRRRMLESIQESSPDFVWIGMTDPKGRIIAATRGQAEGAPMGDRSWFLLGRGRPHASNPRETSAHDVAGTDDSEPTRIFDLSVPVTGLDALFAGVIGAQVRWNWTREVHTSVVSETARRDQIGVTLYSATKEVLLDSGASGWTQPPDAPAATDGRRSRGYVIEDTAVGTRYLTGFARSRGFRDYRGLGWLATVRQPVNRAFAPIEALKRSIFAWGILFVIAVVIGSWIVAGRLAKRLRTIGGAADRIREGDILTVIPRPKGDGELARMCRALGEMVDEFRAKQQPSAERETAKR